MKEPLCKAFCDQLSVRKVPSGLAVTTAFVAADGDRIGFYVVPAGDGKWRIEDDGMTLPGLEASGVDFRSGTRADALRELKGEYGVQEDQEDREFFIDGLSESDVPAAALKFVAFSLRVRDFLLMTEFRVASTFRDDAERMLRSAIGDRASIEEDVPVVADLADFPADFVIKSANRLPVGVFLGVSDNRVLEAIILVMKARHETQSKCKIVALFEKQHSVSGRVYQQAVNRLDRLTVFRGDEVEAINRIVAEAVGDEQRALH